MASTSARPLWAACRRLGWSTKGKTGTQDWRPLYEPIFPEVKKDPGFALVNVCLQGHDYPILEQYQGYVHKTARLMGLQVVKNWAAPARSFSCTVFKPRGGGAPQAVYDLRVYERNLQLADVAARKIELLIGVIATDLPPGVEMTVQEHKEEFENYRYIPDLELKENRRLLDDVENELRK